MKKMRSRREKENKPHKKKDKRKKVKIKEANICSSVSPKMLHIIMFSKV